MENFQAIQPSVLLAPYVKQYWFLTVNDVANGSQRFIPAGSIGIIFNRGDLIYSSTENALFPQSYVFGQTTSYTNLAFKSLNLIIVVLQPIGVNAFLKMSLNELSEQSIALNMLGNSEILELEDRLMGIIDPVTCIYWIEQFLLKYIARFDNYNIKRLTSVVQSINKGERDIKKLSQIACLSYKQFKRIFVEYVGLRPKEFLQITRFSRAVHLLQAQPLLSLSKLADECGYSDKSHLIKDVKRFSGYSPVELRRYSDPYSEYMSLFQSYFINTNTNKKSR